MEPKQSIAETNAEKNAEKAASSAAHRAESAALAQETARQKAAHKEQKQREKAEKQAAKQREKQQRRLEKYDKKTRQEEEALAQAPVGKRPRGRLYTTGEEIVNAITHGVGAALSVAALVWMTVLAVRSGRAVDLASALIYGGTMVILYTMSTLYHAIANRSAKKVFQVFDHCTIYLLIAGTYTPFALSALGGMLGWTIFGAIWALAALGIVLNAVDMKKFRVFSTILYPLMGWAIVAAFKPLCAAVPAAGIRLLVAGGVAYTLGLIFYGLKKYRYMHSVWHLFVLAGSVLHFLSVVLYVL